jgi:cell division protein FtsW (lipid II flippase)
MSFSFSPFDFLFDGLVLLVFVLTSYAGVFVKEKAGWVIVVMASIFSVIFLKGIVPTQYVWPFAGGYFVLLVVLRLYALSDPLRGEKFNHRLTAVLDKMFVFFSGRSLTERVVKLKEWSEKRQAQEKNLK